MNNKQPYYTAADYKRYHSGAMTPAEMNAMEKAAMADPFLQDALDGYAYTNTGEQDMRAVQIRLRNRINSNKKSAPLFPYWLKVAAVLLLAASIAFFIYKSSDEDPASSYAKNDIPENIPSTDSGTTTATPSGTTVEENQQEELATVPNVSSTKPVTQSSPVTPPVNKDYAGKLNAKEVNSGNNPVQSEEAQAKFFVEGKVVDDKGVAVKNASITKKNETLATTKTDGSFVIATNENPVNVEISSEGYSRKKEVLNANRNATVKLERARPGSISAPNNSVISAGANDVAAAEGTPVEGWATYNTYINQNKGIIYGDDGTVQKGRVMLAFQVDTEGTPKDVVIKYSSQVKANAKAINLLKTGPKWIGKPGTFYDLIIDF